MPNNWIKTFLNESFSIKKILGIGDKCREAELIIYKIKC